MKVLMINVVCGIRSTGRICTDIATELEAQGHEVKIAYGRETVPPEFEHYAVRIGSDFDVKVHGAKARLFDGCGFGSKKATIEFVKWIEDYNPDVIHLHNLHGYYINIEILFNYLKTCGKRIIWTLHDCWAFTGHSAYCDAANCDRWKSGCHDCKNIKEYPLSYIDRSRINWGRKKELFRCIPNMTIVTPSDWLAKLVKESFLKEYDVKVIHNGIDTKKFQPLNNDLKESLGITGKIIVVINTTVNIASQQMPLYSKLSELLGEDYTILVYGINREQIRRLPEQIIGIEKTPSRKELDYICSAGTAILDFTGNENRSISRTNAHLLPLGKASGNRLDNSNIIEDMEPEAVKKVVERIIEISSKDNTVGEASGSGFWESRYNQNLCGKFVILGVAAIWDERKGLKDFIKLRDRLDERYQIVLVGLTEEQIRSLPKGIMGMGKTNSTKELAQLYSLADIYVNPTYEDNYPTTNLEAISCGTPVITYNTGGSPESAKSHNGVIVDKGRVDAVVGAINDYLRIKPENPVHNLDLISIDKNTAIKQYLHIYCK